MSSWADGHDLVAMTLTLCLSKLRGHEGLHVPPTSFMGAHHPQLPPNDRASLVALLSLARESFRSRGEVQVFLRSLSSRR